MSLKLNEAQKIQQAKQDQNLDRMVELVVRLDGSYNTTLQKILDLEENKKFYEKEKERSLNEYEKADYERKLRRDERSLEEFKTSTKIYYDDGVEWLRNEHLGTLHSGVELERPNKTYVRVLGVTQDSDSIERLFKLVAFSDQPEICESATDALMKNPFPQEYEDLKKDTDTQPHTWIEKYLDWHSVKSYYQVSRGKNLQWLKLIASSLKTQEEFRSWVIKNALDHSCGLKHVGDCDQYISPKDKYFIAFPFSNPPIFKVIEDAFEERWRSLYGPKHGKKYEACSAGQTIDNGQILCDICKKILYSKFGVFVLSQESGSNLSNPNVMLELGIAMKFGKPCVLLIEAGTKYPADLGGRLYIPYVNDDDLKKGIVEKYGLEKELGIEMS